MSYLRKYVIELVKVVLALARLLCIVIVGGLMPGIGIE
jgi:hypothetical protein